MKSFFCFLVGTFCTLLCIGQKPLIDSAVYGKWPHLLGDGILSNDGNYALYSIGNQPVGSNTLIVQSTNSSWKLEVVGASNANVCRITADSRFAVFTKPNDTLGIVTLGTPHIEYISNVISFKVPDEGSGSCIAYLDNRVDKKLILQNIKSGKTEYFNKARDYLFSPDGKILIVKEEIIKDTITSESVEWINLENGSRKTIWGGTNSGGFVFDATSIRLAFKSEINSINSLWLYNAGDNEAKRLIEDHKLALNSNLKIDGIRGFNYKGTGLYIFLRREVKIKTTSNNAVSIDVWSYTDPKLQSQQLAEVDQTRDYLAILDIEKKNVIRLEQDDERIASILSPQFKDDFILVETSGNGDVLNEWNWNKTALKAISLVSTTDNKRTILKERIPLPNYPFSSGLYFSLSPDCKYVLFYNPKEKNYFSYNVSSGIVRNITKDAISKLTQYDRQTEGTPLTTFMPKGVAAWMDDDRHILIYDYYDIWNIDVSGNDLPVNLTNFYGSKHKIVFGLSINRYDKPIHNNEELTLRAFNVNNMDDGYFKITVNSKKDPTKLTMEPYMYSGPDNSEQVELMEPIKAKNRNLYIVRRMSAEESGNYFVTKDFSTYKPLSTIHPEKGYNWLKSDLISWRSEDGTMLHGILYKPENFDSTKKYPLIFHYYQKFSESLHKYYEPSAANSDINIPYFVSNGYLIFIPDIYYKNGEPGQSAYRSITSAAKCMSKFPYIDSNKLGLVGHSFGAYETDYIISHTNMFAAAVSASGWANAISRYGTVSFSGTSYQRQSEMIKCIVGATLWERPDLYIENSPIFDIANIKTPLLMMNNKLDGQVSFNLGIEMFTGMRRLGKRCWMLQYDREDHVLSSEEAQKDFTIRVKQFFDHYLKETLAPKWMTQGIPAKLKGVDAGLDLDKNIKTPGAGLLMDEKIF